MTAIRFLLATVWLIGLPASAGAQHLHVVDLDGSFAGSAQNREAAFTIGQRLLV